MCTEDRGGKLCEFTHSIFHLSSLLPDSSEIEQFLLKTIKFLIDVITRVDVSIPNFFGLYNDLMVYLEKVSNEGLVHLVQHISKDLVKGQHQNGVGDTENQEVQMDKKFNQRWRDFLCVLIKRIRDIDEIDYEEHTLPGIETADLVLFNWLRITDDEQGFELLADVANSFGNSAPSIEKFCNEVIVLQIGIDYGAEDIDVEMKRRALLTWKSVILTTKVEKEQTTKLWSTAVCAWEMCEEVENEKKEKRQMSKYLEQCLLVGHRVISSNVESARKFLALIRVGKSFLARQ